MFHPMARTSAKTRRRSRRGQVLSAAVGALMTPAQVRLYKTCAPVILRPLVADGPLKTRFDAGAVDEVPGLEGRANF